MKRKELEAILDEVNQALVPALKSEVEKAGATLAKAQPGEATPPEVPADDSATKSPPPADKSAPPADDKSSPPPAPDASASPPAPDAPPAGAPPADDGTGAPAGDPAADMSNDPAELQAAYASLPLEVQQMHYLAVKASLIAAMGGDGSMDDGSGAPPADPAAADPAASAPPAPPAAPPASPPAMKTEFKSDAKANGEDPVAAVAKSEKDLAIESLTKTVKDQGEALGLLFGAVKKVVERPMRKSIASITEVPKAATVDVSQLSKAEVKAKLRKVSERTDLAKSDRERITSYHLGNITVEGVKDLLV